MFGHTAPAAAPPPQRHALGMPAGSIRALLAFGILGLSWLLVWRYAFGTNHKLPVEFIYLQYLGVLILAHYFAAHGNTIGAAAGSRSPLWLPRGTVRLLLMAGYLGLAVFMFMHHQLEFTEPAKGEHGLLVGLLLSSFVLGYLLSVVMKTVTRGRVPAWYQDVQAWLALLALLALATLGTVHFVLSTMEAQSKFDVPTWMEAIPVALVGFYFGARS